MRIAHVITRLILGGAQENTVLNCQGLIEQFGDDVLLITGPGIGPEGDLVPEAQRRGIPLVVLPAMRRAIHPWRDWRSYRAIRRALVEFQPDVVHTHSGKAGLLGRLAAHRLGVQAIIHSIHGAPFHAFQSKAARALFRHCEIFATQRCHRVISVADAMTDQLADAGVAPRDKYVTIYSGMEVEPFLESESHRGPRRLAMGYDSDKIVVVKVARLFHLKGHSEVIDAAKIAIEKVPQLRFLFVGDGVLREQLTRQIATADLTNYFQFTGLVPREEIPALLSAGDIVVHASYREGLARVLPQALLAGRPVVSFDIDGAREVVENNATGFLVEPGDVPGMADRIVQLADSQELRERLGDEGRRRCTGAFRHETMTQKIRQVYELMLAGC